MTQEYFQPILTWIAAHPTWAGFIVFFISLIESLAVIGLIVPGAPIMFAIGIMMGTGDLPFWQTMGWAILGAIVGDAISYWLGYHFHGHLRDFWPFRQFPKMLAKGEDFFKNHGGKSIIFGRFGPLRPVIPVIAGMMDMNPKRFFFFNVFSAFVWAPAYTLPGVLVGVSLGTLSPEVAQRAVILVLLLAVALWLIYMFIRTIGSWVTTLIQKSLGLLWGSWQASSSLPWLHKLFNSKQGTEEGQLGLLLLFLFAIAGFIVTWIDVYYSLNIIEWNEYVYQVLRALYSEKIIASIALITELGNPWVLLPAVTAVGVWLLWRQRPIAVLCWLGTIGIGFMLGYFTKIITAIPRPEGLAYLSDKYSFPSGHALTATLVFGLAAAFIHYSVSPKRRWISWSLSILLILTIAFSRLYLGIHWFTDIIGSLTLGTACVALGTLIYRRVELTPVRLKDVLIPGFLVWFITFSFYATFIYPNEQKKLIRHWETYALVQDAWWKGQELHNDLYRAGAFKRQATLFDVQWLGSLSSVKTVLQKAGFEPIPKLSFKTAPFLLASEPAYNIFPIMPKFHRDRLPMLTVAKSLSHNKRLVLQLWQSDYQNEKQVPLWVGTLRLEETSHPLPLMTFYLESSFSGDILDQLIQAVSTNPKIRFHVLTIDPTMDPNHKPGYPHKILLINST